MPTETMISETILTQASHLFVAEFKSSPQYHRGKKAFGIPPSLNHQLRAVLLDCGPFATHAELRAIFVDRRISPWRNGLPQASSLAEQVERAIDFLHNRYNDVGENALKLFLDVLIDRTTPRDSCFGRLADLSSELEREIDLYQRDKFAREEQPIPILTWDGAQKATKEALKTAVQAYAVNVHVSVMEPLIAEDGLLTKPQVIDELRMIVRFQRSPNAKFIGELWQQMMPNGANDIDFGQEAEHFIILFQTALHDTGIYWLLLFSQSPSQIRSSIYDFSDYLRHKRDSFVGRTHILQQMERFVRHERHKSGYFFLEGDPGSGKSAVMAHFVTQHGCLHHFNIRAEINSTGAFLKNICAQLIAAYELNYASLPVDFAESSETFHQILREVSAKLRAKQEKCLIVVDALDEVVDEEAKKSLFLPPVPPEGIFFLVSRRRKDQPYVKVRDVAIDSYRIAQDEPDDVADVRLFMEQRVARSGLQNYIRLQSALDSAGFVTFLSEKSQGNFYYTRLMLDEIEKGTYDDRKLNRLPQSLENYYQDHWERMKALGEQDWVTTKLPIILALTIAKGAMSFEQISKYAGVEVEAPSKPTIRVVLSDFSQFIYTKYLTYVRNDQSFKEKQYRWYHASFFDFIERKDEIEAGVSLARANIRKYEVMEQQMNHLFG